MVVFWSLITQRSFPVPVVVTAGAIVSVSSSHTSLTNQPADESATNNDETTVENFQATSLSGTWEYTNVIQLDVVR